MANIEGDVQRIDQRTYRVLMQEACEQDVVGDLRERIVKVIEKVTKSDANLTALEE